MGVWLGVGVVACGATGQDPSDHPAYYRDVVVETDGVVDTDALAYFPNREQVLESFSARTPAGPVLTPEDVAGAVYLLCLPEAGMVNGHTLFVDGGFAISG